VSGVVGSGRWGVLVGLVLVAILSGCGTRKTLWQKTIDSGGDETAVAIAADKLHLYVGATLQQSGGQTAWLITKLTRTGSEIWSRTYKESPQAVLGDITADEMGSLFVTGRALVQGSELCLVACYGFDGRLVWQKGLALGERTRGTGICRLSGNRLAVCGMAGTDANADHMVAVLDAKDGKTLWTRNHDICPADLAVRIAADARDNLVAVGQKTGEENADIVVVKMNEKGDTLWTRYYDSGGEDTAGDVAFDPFGNVVVTGTARLGDSTRCIILEYDGDGGVIRKAAYGKQALATGQAISITPEADIFISGALLGRTSEVLVFQYVPNAVSVWERHYSSGGSASGADLVVLKDAYVAATVENKTRDLAVYCFSKPAPLAAPSR
jgi:outer membrane protein assembly factor BamB